MSMFRSLLMVTGGSILPPEYQQVEYIESKGSQYIDTLYKPNVNTKIKMKFSDTSTNRYENYFGSGNNGFRFQREQQMAQRCVAIINNNVVYVNDDFTVPVGLIFTKEKITYYDGTLITNVGASNIVANYAMTIFNSRMDASRFDLASTNMRLYEFQIYENDVLIKNYIPCYRISDSVIGLYDVVNNAFLTNGGSGSFIKGPDV